MPLREYQSSGLEYLRLITALLQHARRAEPTGGLWEAADLQWWWRRDQHPAPAGQTFWSDSSDDRGPVAAVVFTNWGEHVGCDIIVVADAPPGTRDMVVDRALARIGGLRGTTIETIVRDDDPEMLAAIVGAGFVPSGEVAVSTWLAVEHRPAVASIPPGFSLVSRADRGGRPHHMIRRNGEHVAERLAECSLYRPGLDLVVEAPNGDAAAYGLFWADPVTGIGLVEPMRTEDEYQRLGLGRCVLTSGLDRLAAHGCSMMKVTYLEGNDASCALYLGVGFSAGQRDRTFRLET